MPSPDPLEEFVLHHRPELTALDPDLDLIDNRIIDSLAFVELIYFIESMSGVEIDIEHIVLDDFRTLNTIRKRFFDPAGR